MAHSTVLFFQHQTSHAGKEANNQHVAPTELAFQEKTLSPLVHIIQSNM